MEFIVKSKEEAVSENNIQEPHIIVSIFTPGDIPPLVCENLHTKQIIQFAFDDLDKPPRPATRLALGHPVLFGDEEAKEIAERVEFWRCNGVDFVVCHCDAGISRSSGVAAALSKHYNGTDFEFFDPPYMPNMLVYTKVLNALHETQKACQARP
jgi:predicted protein tyrosine phosphatase